MRVLIADGRAGNRASIRAFLDSWECCSAEAPDAATALALMGDAARAGVPFQAALVDIELPGMDTREWTQRVAGDPHLRSTPLLAMIRLGVRTELVKSQAAGFTAHITRPLWKSSLAEALTQALAGREGATRSPNLRKGAATVARHLHVLLVEDNRINQEVATAILRSSGCSTDLARNGREAVHAVQHGKYDLVLMDCEMPEMDGYLATRQIRAYEKSVARQPLPIIAMTAHALDGDREKCLAAGMDDYISKPIDPAGLTEVLKSWPHGGRRGATAQADDDTATEMDSVFDENRLLNRVMGDRDLGRTVVNGFVGRFPDQLSQLQSLADTRDFDGIRLQAHSLKGAAQTLSAADLARTAEELEEAAGKGSLQQVLTALSRLQKTFHEFEQALGRKQWVFSGQKETEDEESYC